MINLELSQTKHAALWVFRIVYRNRKLKDEGSVPTRCVDIDSALMRVDISSKSELLFSNLDGCVIGSEAERVSTPIGISQVGQVVHIDVYGASLVLLRLLRLRLLS